MTYAEIGGLTLPQVRCLLNKGAEPADRLDDPEAIRDWMRRVQQEGE